MIGDAERKKLHVGYKQTVRALKENNAEKLFIAEDCDAHIKNSLTELAGKTDASIIFVSTMEEMGKLCSIEVASSCAVVLK